MPYTKTNLFMEPCLCGAQCQLWTDSHPESPAFQVCCEKCGYQSPSHKGQTTGAACAVGQHNRIISRYRRGENAPF